MKSLIRLAGTMGLLMIITTPLLAEEKTKWSGNIGAGYIQTDGNSESQTFSAEGKVERALKRSKIAAQGKGIYGKSDGVTSDKNWIGSLKYDRSITERATVYLLETAERNTLKGIEFRLYYQTGIGYYLIKAEKDFLQVEIGGGYVIENPVGEKREGYPNGRAFGAYTHSFTEKTRFEQTVEYLPNLTDSEDYIINAESALIVNLIGKFALKASFSVAYDNLPEPGFKNSDRLFKTALLYTL